MLIDVWIFQSEESKNLIRFLLIFSSSYVIFLCNQKLDFTNNIYTLMSHNLIINLLLLNDKTEHVGSEIIISLYLISIIHKKKKKNVDSKNVE